MNVKTPEGTAYERRGSFYIRITTAPRERKSARVSWARSLDEAKARAGEVQALVNRLRDANRLDFIAKVIEVGAAAEGGEKIAELGRAVDGIVRGLIKPKPKAKAEVLTFEAFAMRWVNGELAAAFPDFVERKRSAYVDLCNLRKYVFPIIGEKPIADVTLDDFETVLRHADERAGFKLARSTRRQIAQVTRRVLVLAEYPARVIASNPVPQNAMPTKRTDVALQFAYPEEDALLMKDARTDLGLRLLFGFLHRQGMRRAEVLGGVAGRVPDAADDDEVFGDVPPLTWGRVDLRRGAILPDRNKTGDRTLTPIEPDIARALAAWKRMSPRTKNDDPVFVLADGADIDREGAVDAYRTALREALVAADLDRPELWTKAPGRNVLRLHDARASFVTVALVNGRSEDWVRRRSKHKSSAIERYRRALGTFRELNLGDWVPLDAAIPELAPHVQATPPEGASLAGLGAPADGSGPPAAIFVSRHGGGKVAAGEGGIPISLVGAKGFEPSTPRPPEGKNAEHPTNIRDVASVETNAKRTLPPPCAAMVSAPVAGADEALRRVLDAKLDAAIAAGDLDAARAVGAMLVKLDAAQADVAPNVTRIDAARSKRGAP